MKPCLKKKQTTIINQKEKNERKERLTQPKATIGCIGSELLLHPTRHLSQYLGITDTWSLYFRHWSHCQCRLIFTQEPRTHSMNAHLVHIDPPKQQVHVCPGPRVVDIYASHFFYLFLIVCICGGCAFLLQCVCVMIRGQLIGFCSLPSICGFQR